MAFKLVQRSFLSTVLRVFLAVLFAIITPQLSLADTFQNVLDQPFLFSPDPPLQDEEAFVPEVFPLRMHQDTLLAKLRNDTPSDAEMNLCVTHQDHESSSITCTPFLFIRQGEEGNILLSHFLPHFNVNTLFLSIRSIGYKPYVRQYPHHSTGVDIRLLPSMSLGSRIALYFSESGEAIVRSEPLY